MKNKKKFLYALMCICLFAVMMTPLIVSAAYSQVERYVEDLA